ncbi:hypothetical protein [Paracoccus yeei]|uniref:hypothetical protein n=1 Tax=Paracoccus yeei TaxID=147645 RepID=UPI001749367F|nr:hypothetical protein [Paracoccus yeei]
MDDTTLGLWRLVSDLTIEDAAILIAGGDPSEVDHEDDTFGMQHEVKRTTGHPGFLATFTSLKSAIRKGYLSAHLASRADDGGPYSTRLGADVWMLSRDEVSALRQRLTNDPFVDFHPDGAHDSQFRLEPDWTRTTVDVEDLKVWLRSRGFTTGFFFPPERQTESASDIFMDPTHEHFSAELALAVAAWRGLASEQRFPRGSKAAIEGWIAGNPDAWRGDGDLSTKAKERIVTLVNWRKSGGAPSTGT